MSAGEMRVLQTVRRSRDYVRMGWTQEAMLLRWARQKRSRRTVSARTMGLSLIAEVLRSINSICSGADPVPVSSEETGVILGENPFVVSGSLSISLTEATVDFDRALPCWRQSMEQSCPCASIRRSVTRHWQSFESEHDDHGGQEIEI